MLLKIKIWLWIFFDKYIRRLWRKKKPTVIIPVNAEVDPKLHKQAKFVRLNRKQRRSMEKRMSAFKKPMPHAGFKTKDERNEGREKD